MEKIIEFNKCIDCLTDELRDVLQNVDDTVKKDCFEVRLRKNCPLILYGKFGLFFVYPNGQTSTIYSESLLIIHQKQINDIVLKLSEYSIHSKQNEINNGFITYKNGCRAGICGYAMYENNRISNVNEFSSVNLRVARGCFGCSKIIFDEYFSLGVKNYIIAGPPCSGKTTILRDLAYKISTSHRLEYPKTVIIDERFEFTLNSSGNIGFCDLLKGYGKYDGIVIAQRSLSPDLIICDEITTFEEADKIIQIQNNGICFICSVHASSFNELKCKIILKHLLENGQFEGVILLSSGSNPGIVEKYYKSEELI